MIIAIAYCYCVLLKVIAIAYCYCVLLRVIAIAYCYCLLLLLRYCLLLLPIAYYLGLLLLPTV